MLRKLPYYEQTDLANVIAIEVQLDSHYIEFLFSKRCLAVSLYVYESWL